MRRQIAILFVAFSLFFAGCSPQNCNLVERQVSNFTYYFADHKGRIDEPLIVLCHGMGGNHTDMESMAEIFYEAGYAVVTFDLYGHEGIAYDNDIYLDEMIEISESRIQNILLDLQEGGMCDSSSYGIGGYSLGGMLAFYTTAYGETVPKIVISLAAIPDFVNVLEKAGSSMASKYSAKKWRLEHTTEEENRKLLEWASSHNPADQIERLTQVPIIMVNGTDDTYMSIEYAREFQEEIKTAGGYIRVFENLGGTHTDLGDYHMEEILQITKEILPADE